MSPASGSSGERCKTKSGRERSEAAEEEGGEEEFGKRVPVKKANPREPTKEEREEHEKTHIPFRNWCRHCVRGRGKEDECRRTDREPEKPEVHLDFMFMGEEKSEKTLVILVAKERTTKAVMGCVVPRKSEGEWLAKRVMAFMREFGCELEQVTMKTDNEPALVAVAENVGRLRAAKGGVGMVVEHSPVHSSKSNGIVERAVQSVQGVIRTMRSAVEEKWGVKLEVDHAVWPWLVEYAGWLLTRAEVGADGKTAYERSRGKEAKLPGVEFGEGVLWKRRREGGPLGKLTCMWEDGVFLGVKGSTGEMIVGDEKGVWRTRTLRRKPEGERWSRENLKYIGGVPWKLVSGGGEEGEGPKTEVIIMDKEYRERMKAEDHETVPRKVYITKEDLETHGYTAKCPGCISILRGTARQAHIEACRRRVEKELEGTEKARRAKKRIGEYVDKKMAEEEERRRETTEDKKGETDQRKEAAVGGRGEEDVDMERRMEVERGIRSSGSGLGSSSGGGKEEKGKRKREGEDEATEENTLRILRKLERKEERKRKREGEDEATEENKREADKEAEDMGEVSEEEKGGKKVHGFDVNEEVLDVEFDDVGESGWTEEQDELDRRLTEEGTKEEVDYMVKKLNMFEFGTLEEAWERGKKKPTTTKWVRGWKTDDDGRRFVRCRLVARDFKVKNEKARDDLFASMPPLEAKKMMFRMTAGVRGWRRRHNREEIKLMFIDVKRRT